MNVRAERASLGPDASTKKGTLMIDRQTKASSRPVPVVILGTVLLFVLLLLDGTERWLVAALVFIAMIAFLIPVLAEIRRGNSR